MEFPTTSLMAHLFLALFLIVFGLNLLFGLSIPIWVTGLLALIAGILLVMDHFRVHMDRK
jgi:sterol desaturase/sphingolipid hydroxylase (fatty acid hydroxylase superfamily)